MRLVYIAIAWIVGIGFSASVGFLSREIWLVGIILSLIIFGLTFRRVNLRWWIIALVALMVGGWRYSFVPQTSDIAQYNGNVGTIEGIVIAEPDIRDDRIQLQVDVQSIFTYSQTYETSGQVLVEASTLADVTYGDKIRATGALISPAEFDTFSYADYLARQGVFTIMSYASVEVLDRGYASPFFAGLINFKRTVQGQISLMLPEPQAGLLAGILLGNERGISPELGDDFSRVGASHIVAISGFNMVILSGIVMRFFERIFKERRWLAALMGAIVIALYTLFVGANAAVIRAAIMSSLLVIAPILKRKTYVPASLAAVTLFQSFLTPTVLWDISFQLSLFAVLGLALFVDPLSYHFEKLLNRWFPAVHANFIHSFLNEPLIVSLAAQIATLPLIILYFQRLSIVSIPVNLLIVPAQSVLLLIGMSAVILSFISFPLGQVIFWVDLIFLSWSIEIVRLFARIEFADVPFAVDSRLIALFYIFLIGGAMLSATRPAWWIRLSAWMRRRIVLLAIVGTGIISSLLMASVYLSRPDGKLHIWFLDMGHSNAVLMQSPKGGQILIDGGRFPSRLLTAIGDRLPFYDREIELLIVTHPDEFDISALNAVLDRYTIGAAVINGQPNLSETYQELSAKIASYPLVTVQAGYTVEFDDGLKIEILNPPYAPSLADGLGDFAITLRVSYGEHSFLLMSDVTAEGQMMMLEGGIDPTSSLMQVPQHATGRALDGQFLQLAQPQVAIIQSDPTNRRGDPNEDTLAQLGEIPIFRTDEGGTIHLWSDGLSLWMLQAAP